MLSIWTSLKICGLVKSYKNAEVISSAVRSCSWSSEKKCIFTHETQISQKIRNYKKIP